MRALGSLNEYWNRRLDPLDWKRVRDHHDPARWRTAHRTYLDPATADAIAGLGDPAGKRLLEVGCGQGHGTLHLVERSALVTGIDVSDRRCEVARREVNRVRGIGQARFCAARAEGLPFAAGSFDLVFCRDVLMYADARRVMRECHRVLRDGGRAVFVESLAGTTLLRGFRRLTSPREYRAFTRHLSWSEIRELDTPLRRVGLRPYYLLSLTAFVWLFLFRAAGLYRQTLRYLEPADRWLFEKAPALAGLAWRAVACYEKQGHAR